MSEQTIALKVKVEYKVKAMPGPGQTVAQLEARLHELGNKVIRVEDDGIIIAIEGDM